MSLVETALQKAKLAAEPRARMGTERDRRISTAAATGSRAVATRQERTVPQFPQIPYDPLACAANRILLTPGRTDRLRANSVAAYRMLRTRVLQRLRTNNWTSIGITSPGPAEGKTLTAINLAVSIAHENNSDVFLIDLDMRQPGMCAALGIHPPHDLVGYFTGKFEARDTLFTIGVENLVISSGCTPCDHSSDLLANDRLPQLLTYLRSLSPNALIVVDLPPVLNADDALVVAPLLDTLLLVAAEGKTRRDGLKRTLDVLSEFEITGVVLNRSHDSFGGEYYGY